MSLKSVVNINKSFLCNQHSIGINNTQYVVPGNNVASLNGNQIGFYGINEQLKDKDKYQSNKILNKKDRNY